VQADAECHHIGLFPAERRYSLSSLEAADHAETENIPVFVLTGRDLGEVTERSLMREVHGKPGVLRVFRKSFDTDEIFGALRKLCGFEQHGVSG